MSRCVIVGGAEIRRYDEVKNYLRPGDYYIFCDNGLRHLEALGIQPDLIIGDFDSHAVPHLPVETIFLPREKDDTDSVYAAREAVKRGFNEFLLIGVRGMIVDDYSEMEIVSGEAAEIGPEFPFFSLLNISGTARGVNIENAKFPLKDGEIDCEYQYGVSNEPLSGKTARVTVAQGRLLLVRDRR